MESIKFEENHTIFDENRLHTGPNHYNPSIIDHEGGYLLTYRIQYDDGPIPHNYICRLTSDFVPLQSYKVDYGTLVPKLSDIRLFKHLDQLMCSFSVKDEKKWRQGVANITPEGQISDLKYVSLSKEEDEKNFQFFSIGDRLYAIACIAPKHIVIDVETGERHESDTSFDWPYGQPRGGTPPVKYGNQWLTCFHSSQKVENLKSQYVIGWYTFENIPPFRITAMSKTPPMHPSSPWTRMSDKPSRTQRDKAVLFPCGLIQCNDDYLLTYGLNDVAPGYRIFTQQQIEASIMARNLVTWKRKSNFGDRLSRPILEYLGVGNSLGREICTTNNTGRHRLLGLGTIFHLAKSGDVVWGSGLGNHLKHNKPYKPEPGIKILAVRGPKTRRLYLESGGENCPEIYGDPAILLPDYYTPKPVRSEIAILPHIYDLEMISIFPDAKKINAASSDIWGVIDQIAGCELLITSSLHGLIIAEAYGVPVVLYTTKSFQLKEPLFKYEDYFESTGRIISLLEDGGIEEAEKLLRNVQHLVVPNGQVLRDSLIEYMI